MDPSRLGLYFQTSLVAGSRCPGLPLFMLRHTHTQMGVSADPQAQWSPQQLPMARPVATTMTPLVSRFDTGYQALTLLAG